MNVMHAFGGLLRRGVVVDSPASAVTPEAGGARAANAGARSAGEVDGPRVPAKPAAPPVEWLRPQEIVLDVDVPDSRRALETAAAHLGRAHGIDPAPVFRALWRREQVGSTALGYGVAIPHARIEGIAHPVTLFMRTRYAMEFGAPDRKPVSNLLVIMVPADGDTDAHLQLLASISMAFSNREFRAQLSAATTAEDVDKAFAEWTRDCHA
jgi:PTS system nitrogen regulatory IIA component